MKTIEVKLYEFSELSNEAKQVALNEERHTLVNIFRWWDDIFSDANNIGVEIVNYGIPEIHILIKDIQNTKVLIKENHGKNCGSYKSIGLPNDKFISEIKQYYIDLLSSEYDYLISDKRCIETFKQNDYYFLSTGEFYNENK